MMRFNRLKAKLKFFYKIFIASPSQWKLPNKSEILIHDTCGTEALAPYLTEYSVEIIPLRGESVNIPCLLRAILRLSFWRGKPIQVYTDEFIQTVSPKVVITFIDNNPSFYTISNRFPDIKTILLQNGLRDNWLDGFSGSNKYHVDYMLVFNSSIGSYYRSHISGKVVSAGSLRNNHFKSSGDFLDGTVLFISQYCDLTSKNNAPFLTDDNGEPVYRDQFYSAEVIALRFLAKWCVENKKSLKIAGMSPEKMGPEIDFLEAILSGCAWEFIPRSDQYSSYKLVDAAEIVVFISSTLGYESIGRGKRTAALTCRGSSILSVAAKFGWPADLPNNGPFWTNDVDERQFQRVMEYLNTVSDEEWEQTRQLYASELMEFDPGNTRFVGLLDQLLPRTESQAHAN